MALDRVERPARQNLAQAVATQILDAIRSGALEPGEALPTEEQLRIRFGVARSTIREALNGLVLLGAIEVRHGHGAYVIGYSGQSTGRLDGAMREAVTQELLEAREATEPNIARFAARRATAADLKEIKGLLAATQEKLDAGSPAAGEAARFHLLIAEATGNQIFCEFIESILGLLNERGEALGSVDDYARWELEAHRDILAAIESGDAALAAEAMTVHLQKMRSILMSGWEAFVQSGMRAAPEPIGDPPRSSHATT